MTDTGPPFRLALLATAALAMGHPGPQPLPAQTPLDPVGHWRGTLQAGAADLTIVFHVERSEEGALTATLDSPDQGAMGIPVSGTAFSGDTLTLTVAAIGGRYQGVLSSDGSTLDGTWSQGGATLPLVLERSDEAEEARPRPQEPQPPFPYRVVEVVFRNGAADIELAGTLTLPEGEGPFPGAVLVSGSGPQDRDEALMGHRPFLVLADHLTRRGIAVLRYDDRGVGGSGGDFGSATTEDFAEDALAAVRFLRDRAEVQEGSVGIVGHSEGGVVAPMAANRSDDVAYVVLLAGTSLTGEEILHLQGRLIALANGATEEAVEANRKVQSRMFRAVAEESDPEALRGRLNRILDEVLEEMSPEERQEAGVGEDLRTWKEAQIRSVATPWFRFFLTYDPARALEELEAPVLALFGEKDLQVPADENLPAMEAALERGGNPDYTVRRLEGLNHLFQPAGSGSPLEYARIETTFDPGALEIVSEWILARFDPGTPSP